MGQCGSALRQTEQGGQAHSAGIFENAEILKPHTGNVLYYSDIKISKKMAAFLHFKAEELGLPPKSGKGDGYIHIPARSWLQMPIQKKNALKNKIIKKFGEAPESVENYIADTGDLMSLAIMVGVSAVEQIQEAFESEGFGQWAPNSALTVAQKGSAMPLIDTGKLRGAVTYEVNENG